MEPNGLGVLRRIPQICVSVRSKGIARVFSDEAGQVLLLMHWPRSSVHHEELQADEMQLGLFSPRTACAFENRRAYAYGGLRPGNIDSRSQRTCHVLEEARKQKLVNSMTTISCLLTMTLLPLIAPDLSQAYCWVQVTTRHGRHHLAVMALETDLALAIKRD